MTFESFIGMLSRKTYKELREYYDCQMLLSDSILRLEKAGFSNEEVNCIVKETIRVVFSNPCVFGSLKEETDD